MIKSYMGSVELRGTLPVLRADLTMIVRAMRDAYEEVGMSEEEFLDDLAECGQAAMKCTVQPADEQDQERSKAIDDLTKMMILSELLEGM